MVDDSCARAVDDLFVGKDACGNRVDVFSVRMMPFSAEIERR